jgi:hypothetical protein
MDPSDILYRSKMSAHGLIGFEERPLGKEMQLKVGEEWWKRIGIMPFRDIPCMVGDAETIGAGSERL